MNLSIQFTFILLLLAGCQSTERIEINDDLQEVRLNGKPMTLEQMEYYSESESKRKTKLTITLKDGTVERMPLGEFIESPQSPQIGFTPTADKAYMNRIMDYQLRDLEERHSLKIEDFPEAYRFMLSRSWNYSYVIVVKRSLHHIYAICQNPGSSHVNRLTENEFLEFVDKLNSIGFFEAKNGDIEVIVDGSSMTFSYKNKNGVRSFKNCNPKDGDVYYKCAEAFVELTGLPLTIDDKL